MIRTLEAVIDEGGNVRLLEGIQLPAARRALVTILEDSPATPSDGVQSELGLEPLFAELDELTEGECKPWRDDESQRDDAS
jgi:hypothetical protein